MGVWWWSVGQFRMSTQPEMAQRLLKAAAVVLLAIKFAWPSNRWSGNTCCLRSRRRRHHHCVAGKTGESFHVGMPEGRKREEKN